MRLAPRHAALLRAMLATPTAPFGEARIAALIKKTAHALGLTVASDRFGNLFIRTIASRRAALRDDSIAFVAHMDHPGFEVTGMVGNRVVARFHGGVPASIFDHAPVVFFAAAASDARINGTIVRAEPRPGTPNRIGRVQVRVAEGDLSQLQPGDIGQWNLGGPSHDGGFLRAVAVDDLGGCALILAALGEIVRRKLDVDLWAVFTRAEEVGLVGATGIATTRGLPQKLPIVSVECSKEQPWAKAGDGVIVRIGDKVVSAHPRVNYLLQSAASEAAALDDGFRFQRALMPGGTCEATVFAAFGYEAGAISLPMQNYHNVSDDGALQREAIHIDDFAFGVELIVAAASLGPRKSALLAAWREQFQTRNADALTRLETGSWPDPD